MQHILETCTLIFLLLLFLQNCYLFIIFQECSDSHKKIFSHKKLLSFYHIWSNYTHNLHFITAISCLLAYLAFNFMQTDRYFFFLSLYSDCLNNVSMLEQVGNLKNLKADSWLVYNLLRLPHLGVSSGIWTSPLKRVNIQCAPLT